MALRKKQKKIIAIGSGLVLLIGAITGIAIATNNKEPKGEESSGVVINAGDAGKDNEAEFNAQEYTTEPVSEIANANEQVANDEFKESTTSIQGSWATYSGDILMCDADGNIEINLITGQNLAGTIDTDNKTYLKINGDTGTIEFDIKEFIETTEGTVILNLVNKADNMVYMFIPRTEDRVSSEVENALKEHPNGIVEEDGNIAVDGNGNVVVDGDNADIVQGHIGVVDVSPDAQEPVEQEEPEEPIEEPIPEE